MHMPRLKTNLRVAGVGLSTAAVLTAFTCLFWTVDVVSPTEESITRAENNAVRHVVSPHLTIKQFEPLWQKPLRRPLVDPPKPQTVISAANTVAQQPQSLPNVRLLGIALEAGHSMAFFAMPQGVIELRGIGETLGDSPGGPQVASIEDQKVVIRFQGRQINMPLEGGTER
jgi:hypothetical protein